MSNGFDVLTRPMDPQGHLISMMPNDGICKDCTILAGKADITLEQVMSHRGGFPSGDVTKATWTDHKKMRAEVCDFSLDWTPGSRLQYHARAAFRSYLTGVVDAPGKRGTRKQTCAIGFQGRAILADRVHPVRIE